MCRQTYQIGVCITNISVSNIFKPICKKVAPIVVAGSLLAMPLVTKAHENKDAYIKTSKTEITTKPQKEPDKSDNAAMLVALLAVFHGICWIVQKINENNPDNFYPDDFGENIPNDKDLK